MLWSPNATPFTADTQDKTGDKPQHTYYQSTEISYKEVKRPTPTWPTNLRVLLGSRLLRVMKRLLTGKKPYWGCGKTQPENPKQTLGSNLLCSVLCPVPGTQQVLNEVLLNEEQPSHLNLCRLGKLAGKLHRAQRMPQSPSIPKEYKYFIYDSRVFRKNARSHKGILQHLNYLSPRGKTCS